MPPPSPPPRAQATAAAARVEAHARGARAALGELLARLRLVSAERGAVRPLLDTLARCIARLTEHRYPPASGLLTRHSFI